MIRDAKTTQTTCALIPGNTIFMEISSNLVASVQRGLSIDYHVPLLAVPNAKRVRLKGAQFSAFSILWIAFG